jgi:uncharacterized membrane protein YukC
MHSRSPLHCAAKKIARSALSFCCELAQKKNAKNMHSKTPLHNADKNRRTKCVKKLLRNGADKKKDMTSRTELHCAAQNKNEEEKKADAARRGRYIRAHSTSPDVSQDKRQSKTGLQRLKSLAS